MRLGKLPPRIDPRTIQFADLTKKLAPAPPSYNLTQKISNLGMMLNDRLGDCTCACAGHIIQQWTAEAGSQVILPDSVILSLYEAMGYNPNDPSTDNGAVVLDVLNYWRKNGVGGHGLKAYAALKPHSVQQAKDSIYYFGNTYLGVALPLSAQNQDVWSVVNNSSGEPGSWGGHAIPLVSYDASGPTCITWGQYKKMTWSFYEKYCDEAYSLLSLDWIENSGKCPADLDLAALETSLKEITCC